MRRIILFLIFALLAEAAFASTTKIEGTDASNKCNVRCNSGCFVD